PLPPGPPSTAHPASTTPLTSTFPGADAGPWPAAASPPCRRCGRLMAGTACTSVLVSPLVLVGLCGWPGAPRALANAPFGFLTGDNTGRTAPAQRQRSGGQHPRDNAAPSNRGDPDALSNPVPRGASLGRGTAPPRPASGTGPGRGPGPPYAHVAARAPRRPGAPGVVRRGVVTVMCGGSP